MTHYNPPRLLRNPHLQSIFASAGPRKWLVRRQARPLLAASETQILTCNDGVRLQGELALHPRGNGALVTLIHGWEGCADSLYLLSLGQRLFQSGYSVFRLNLRDHGPTHHLNRELFNSTRIREVVDAVARIQQHWPHSQYFLGGFSLGGNFALRVAAHAPQAGINLAQVVAVCPVVNPVRTMNQLEQGWWVYHHYFRRKWRRSLRRKLRHFPELGYGEDLLQLSTLRAMNQYFVPRYTDFPDTHSYLMGYALVGSTLAKLEVPCHIITSRDDPMIAAGDFAELAATPALTLEVTDYGGHRGFIENLQLQSWVDRRIQYLFDQARVSRLNAEPG